MGQRILVVDDEDGIVLLLKDYLELQGYKVITAGGGMEALEKISREPDLILLDINMPDMDGLSVCRKIRAQVNCPIIFLSARAEEQDRITGLMLGGDDYIVKPFSIEELGARVAAHFRREERGRWRETVKTVVYSRGASSAVVVGTRYAALVFMHMIPVLILSLLPTVNCITAGIEGVHLDYLAWLKYDLGWLLPTVMIVAAVGMLCTELTESALAVLVQAVWWFVSVMTGAAGMNGGRYGWNLIPRHNTELNYAGFAEDFRQLAMNRILYAVLALVLLALTIVIYEKKRKGHLRRRGKIFGNHKRTAEA